MLTWCRPPEAPDLRAARALRPRIVYADNRRRQGDLPPADRSIEEMVHCRVLTPVSVPGASGFTIIRCDFTIELDPSCSLHWLRFEVVLPQPVASFAPRLLTQPRGAPGLVGVDEAGRLSLADDDTEQAVDLLPAPVHLPMLLGRRIGPTSVMWDFHPLRQDIRHRSAGLLLAVRDRPATAALEARLAIAIGRAQDEPEYLEIPAERLTVRPATPPQLPSSSKLFGDRSTTTT